MLILSFLVGSALGTAACDEASPASLIVAPSTTIPPALASLGPIGLTTLSQFDCSGFVLNTSFNVIVVSSGQDLTMDRVTLHMIDGTNLGGPSVTIPSSQLNAQFGATLGRAGTSRVFPFDTVFGCTVTPPQSMAASVVLTDQRGISQTVVLTAEIH